MSEKTQNKARCHTKNTPRTAQMQDDITKRINRIIGQLGGIKNMVDENRYCGDILTQLAATENALQGISSIILKNHLETCVVEQIQAGNTEVVDELIRLIKKFS